MCEICVILIVINNEGMKYERLKNNIYMLGVRIQNA